MFTFISRPLYGILGTVKNYFSWTNSSTRTGSSLSRVKGGISNPGILYAFQTGNNTFKVGKTKNLEQRLRPYRTIHPRGKVLHKVECNDMHHSERILHEMLKSNGHHVSHEIFQIEGRLLIQYLDLVKELERCLKQESLSTMEKMTAYIRKL